MVKLFSAFHFEKRKLATNAIVAFILGSLLGGAMWNLGGIYTDEK